MTTPKFALLAALSLALITPLVPAFAQAPGAPMHGPMGGPAHGPMGGMHSGGQRQSPAEALGLTDAQKSRMKPILMSAGRQAQAIQQDAKLTPAARMAKMRGLQQSVSAQMTALLTPAQRVKLKAMQAQRQAHPM